MDNFVKIELPEATEYDVYLDIDGTIEENYSHAVSDPEPVLPVENGEDVVQSSWQAHRNAPRLGHASSTITSATEQDFLLPVASTSAQAWHSDYSDDGEIDIDTPYDGKLMGQSEPRFETSDNQTTLLSRLLSFARASNLVSNVAKKSTSQKKPHSSSAVAKKSTTPQTLKTVAKNKALKSTTPKKPSNKNVSNIAKKSTAKQSRPNVPFVGSKSGKAKNSAGLQVKVGPCTAPVQVVPRVPASFGDRDNPVKKAHFKGISSSSLSAFSGLSQPSLSERSIPKVSTISVPTKISPGISLKPPATNTSVFACIEQSGEKIPCPECDIMLKQYSVRSHLRSVHNLPMKNCKKCRLSFTDLNLFSEHYALHLQQEEDRSAGVRSSPVQLNVGTIREAFFAPSLLSQKPRKPSQAVVSGPPNSLPAESPSISSKVSSFAVPKPSQKPSLKNILPSQASVQKTFKKLSRDFSSESNEVPIPVQPESPPKAQKPPSMKQLSSSVSPFNKFSSDVSAVSDVPFPVQPKLPPKPRKPSLSKKRPSSSAASRISAPVPFSVSDETESLTERRSSSSSLQSDISSSSDVSGTTRQASSCYSKNQKAAFRRGLSSVSSASVSPPKKPRIDRETNAVVTKRTCEQTLAVSLASLETASQPFSCKICLAAFHVALTCPQSFRRLTQNKFYTCRKCSAIFRRSEEHQIHQEVYCSAASGKTATGKRSACNTTPTSQPKTTSSEEPANDTQNSPVKSGPTDFYECHVCKQRFQYRSMLLRHVSYHSSQYSCGFCKKSYEKKVDLLDHFQIMHDGRTRMRCRYCEKKFEHVSEFDRHIGVHKGGTVVACTVCKKKFSDSKQMLTHLRNAHDTSHSQNKLSCEKCGKVFQQAQHLSLHIKFAHGSGKPIVTKFLSCRFCKKVFHKKQGLSSHYRLVHGMSISDALSTINTGRFSAPTVQPKQVNKDYNVQSRLKKIPDPAAQTTAKIPVTAQGRGNQCHICHRSYSERKSLVKHCRNIHGIEMSGTESSTLKCKLCGGKMHTLKGLKTHYKLRHNRSMPTAKTSSKRKGSCKCFMCGMCFSQKSSVYRHIRIVHGKTAKTTIVKPGSGQTGSSWACKVCCKSFASRKAVRIHMKILHPESFEDERLGSRKCSRCGKSFGSRPRLLAHSMKCGFKKTPSSKMGGNTGNNRSGVFPCSLCDKVFNWSYNVNRHLQTHHGLSRRDISYNMNFLSSAPPAKSHFSPAKSHSHPAPAKSPHLTPAKSHPDPAKSQPVSKIYLCKVCNVCFGQKKSFRRHQQRRHNENFGVFQCRVRHCKRTFSKSVGLRNHILKTHKDMPFFLCRECNSGFKTSVEALGHNCIPATHSEAFSSARAEELAQQDSSSSQAPRQECRYRCMTCDEGFYIAREWTKHMQEHADSIGVDFPDYEKVLDATDKIRLNIFDIMSAESVFTCQFCDKVFTDKSALTLHSCEKLLKKNASATETNDSSTDRIRVQCTVCLKFFSPLSIRKHMLNIHSLQMRMCKKCNLVFTDLEHFKKHCSSHKELSVHEGSDQGNAASAADDSEDTSVTFFVCQSCGGLFIDADLLKSHVCSEKGNDEELPTENSEELPTENSEELPTVNSEELSKNSEELLTENNDELPTENSEVLPTENSEALPTENSEALPTENSDELPTENSGALPTENSEELPTENSEELPTENSEALPTENSEELPTENSEELPTENSEALSTENNEELPTENSEELPTVNSEALSTNLPNDLHEIHPGEGTEFVVELNQEEVCQPTDSIYIYENIDTETADNSSSVCSIKSQEKESSNISDNNATQLDGWSEFQNDNNHNEESNDRVDQTEHGDINSIDKQDMPAQNSRTELAEDPNEVQKDLDNVGGVNDILLENETRDVMDANTQNEKGSSLDSVSLTLRDTEYEGLDGSARRDEPQEVLEQEGSQDVSSENKTQLANNVENLLDVSSQENLESDAVDEAAPEKQDEAACLSRVITQEKSGGNVSVDPAVTSLSGQINAGDTIEYTAGQEFPRREVLNQTQDVQNNGSEGTVSLPEEVAGGQAGDTHEDSVSDRHERKSEEADECFEDTDEETSIDTGENLTESVHDDLKADMLQTVTDNAHLDLEENARETQDAIEDTLNETCEVNAVQDTPEDENAKLSTCKATAEKSDDNTEEMLVSMDGDVHLEADRDINYEGQQAVHINTGEDFTKDQASSKQSNDDTLMMDRTRDLNESQVRDIDRSNEKLDSDNERTKNIHEDLDEDVILTI